MTNKPQTCQLEGEIIRAAFCIAPSALPADAAGDVIAEDGAYFQKAFAHLRPKD